MSNRADSYHIQQENHRDNGINDQFYDATNQYFDSPNGLKNEEYQFHEKRNIPSLDVRNHQIKCNFVEEIKQIVAKNPLYFYRDWFEYVFNQFNKTKKTSNRQSHRRIFDNLDYSQANNTKASFIQDNKLLYKIDELEELEKQITHKERELQAKLQYTSGHLQTPDLASLISEIHNYENMRSQLVRYRDGYDYSLMNSIDVSKSVRDDSKKSSNPQIQDQSFINARLDLQSLKISMDQDSLDVQNSKHRVDLKRMELQDQNDKVIKQLVLENKQLEEQLDFFNSNYQPQSEMNSLTQSQMVGTSKFMMADPVVEHKWQQIKTKWTETKRYPLKNLSKQRIQYEMALFDIERKRVWKYNFVTLFTNILRSQKRKERLIKVIGFHKFVRNVALLSRVTQTHTFKLNSFAEEQILISNAVKRATKEVVKPKETSKPKRLDTQQSEKTNRSITPKSRGQNKQQPEKQAAKEKSKNQIDVQSEYNQAIRTLSQRVQKLSSVGKMVKLYQRKELEDGQKLAIGFARWMRYNVEWENKALQEELTSITFVLNERVFRENFLRTKLKLAKSEMDSKITLINELLFTILAKSK